MDKHELGICECQGQCFLSRGQATTEESGNNEWGESPRYNWHSKAECIDIIEEFPYNLANAMKYIWRAGAPAEAYDGDREEDLRKAIRYLERQLGPLEETKQPSPPVIENSLQFDAEGRVT